MKKLYKAYYKSPIGNIEIISDEEYILALDFIEEESTRDSFEDVPEVLKKCVEEIDEYFKGTRKEFTVKVKVNGTEFQEKVWNELQKIPYGKVCSYKDIAAAVGNEKAVRAVGGANHRNKISIIIPCHRVVGKDGSLIGYGGGLWRKKWLLDHEGVKIK